jgi:hypothetical protein
MSRPDSIAAIVAAETASSVVEIESLTVSALTASGDGPVVVDTDGHLITTVIAPVRLEKAHTAQLLSVNPTPRPRRPSLKTLPEVRREMARVYRDMRHGRIEAQDGTRLTYVLTQITKTIQAAELDARVEAVERALKLRSP